MDFAALYKSKLTTPEEAVKVVKSGDWVDYGWGTGTPNALDKALAARMDELENVNFRCCYRRGQQVYAALPRSVRGSNPCFRGRYDRRE